MEREVTKLHFDLGAFEGFNFRDQCAIAKALSAQDVVNWDHDKSGEAEFWPSGDCEGVALLFKGKGSVTSAELLALDSLLQELGEDTNELYLLIHYAVNVRSLSLIDLDSSSVTDDPPYIYTGDCFTEARKNAAYDLFENFYPDAYRMWETTNCDGLIFDTDRFLDSPSWSVEEVKIGGEYFVLVEGQ